MTPIVCLHGFLGDGRDMEPLAARITARLGDTRPVVTPSLPGHGPAPEPLAGRGNPFFAAVDFLVAKLQLNGLNRYHIVGYSLGGRVTYGLLTKYPERVASATTIGASPGIAAVDARRARAERDRALSVRLEAEGLPAFLESWYALSLFDSLRAHPGFADLVDRRRQGQAPALAAALRAMSPGVMPDLAPDLAATEVPITAIAGALDETYVDVVARLDAASPRVRARHVEGAGHAAHIERPDVVAEFVVEQIAEQEGSAACP